jgi:hypothetical protein
MAICYLEVDDEITGAVARLRAIDDEGAVLMLPPGSRIGTSRINFKLLAREAADRGMTLVAVSDEPQVRALAISAGVPAYDSLAAAEGALRSGVEPAVATPPSVAAAASGPPAIRTSVEEPPGRATRRDDRPRRRRRWLVAALAGLALLAIVAGGGAYAAWYLLPTATITLRPPPLAEGPVVISVTADPNTAVVDPSAAAIPARRLALPLTVEGTFAATGVQVTRTAATGTVRFRSENTASEIRVAEGTVVATRGGTKFSTARTVVVPRAVFATGTPGTVNVDVLAVRAGEGGNVAADTITVLPRSLRGPLLSVRNPAATRGGSRTEQPQVTQEDYDAAATALDEQLADALAAAIDDPASVPAGLTLYPETVVAGAAQVDTPPADLVGSLESRFELSAGASATVLAVDETQIDVLAAEALRAQLPAARQLIGNVQVSHVLATADPAAIVYRATATAQSYIAPPVDELLAQVRGKAISEAQAVLERYGSVEIEIWPEFVDRLPDAPGRLTFDVVAPTAASP